MSSVNVGVDVTNGMRSGLSKYFLSFTAVGFVLPLYLLLLSGFPFFDAVKVVSVVLIQIAAGASIWLNIMNPRSVAAVESVGMGLALGSIFGVVGHQLFLSTPIRSFGWLLPVVVALIVHFFSRKNQITRKSFADSELSSLFFVVLAVVVILTQWWWLLPLALPTGLALYLLSDTGKRKLASQGRTLWVLIALLFIAATFTMLYLRQLNLDWWIRSWDLQFHESRSYSIAKFGPNDNISIVGKPLAYHWFGLAWLGSISIVCDLAPWLSTTQVGPIYVTVVIGSLIGTLAKKLSETSSSSYILLFSFSFGLSSLFSTANPPNIVSLIWLFAAIIAAELFFNYRQNRFFIAFTLCSLAAFSTKISTGFSLLFGFILTDFYLQLKQRRKFFKPFIRTFALGAGSIFVFTFVIGGLTRSGVDFVDWSFKRPGQFFGVEIGRALPIQILGFLGYIFGLLPASFLLVSNFVLGKNQRAIEVFLTFGFLSIIIPSFAFDDNLGYFVLSAKTLAILGSAVLFSTADVQAKLKKFNRYEVWLFSLLAFVLTFLYQSFLKVDWLYHLNLRGGLTPINLLITSSYFLLIFLITDLIQKRKHLSIDRRSLFSLSLVFIFLLIGAVTYSASLHLKSLPSRAASRDLQNEVTGSEDTVNASAWVMKNSASNDIFATNRFCIKELDGVEATCSIPKFLGVSATARMRLLIEGPFYVVGYGGDDETLYPAWAKERLDLSRGFADKPNAEITAKLQEYGVDWFYLFKENTTNRNWEPYGTVKYENTEVAIIQLNDK